ncbi:hypothetical protein HY418_00725 [Candidatus Kaiserbacteria bacterium]|nr:hypothetical protein [Candidatus Kaiserbacteria bacterium]
MKICYFLQRNFASVGDAIAANLRDRYGVNEACAYVGMRTALGVLKEKGMVRYSTLLLDEDIHATFPGVSLDMEYLRILEEKCGIPNLWPYLMADRTLMSTQPLREYPYDRPLESHEDLLRILQVTAQAIEKLLDTEKPGAVVFPVVGSLGSMLLYHIARTRGIETRLMFPVVLENRYMVSSRYDCFSLREELGESFATLPPPEHLREARRFLESFRKAPKPYVAEFSPDKQQINRMRQLKFLRPDRLLRSVGAIFREFRLHLFGGIARDYSSVHPFHFIVDRVKRKIRNARGVADLYDVLPPNEPYAFYPLHFEPEIALLVQGSFVTNQLEVIRQAARSLPVGWKLYVKEHPQMVEYRPRSFYQQLKKIPNVRLVDPSIKSFEVIAGSSLVIVISGTAGFEACLMKKPLITLGSQFFNDFSFVKHCTGFEQLPALVHEQVTAFRYDESELHHYLAKMFEVSAIIDMGKLWYRQASRDELLQGVAALADALARSLRLRQTT